MQFTDVDKVDTRSALGLGAGIREITFFSL